MEAPYAIKDGTDATGRRQPGEAGYGPHGATNPTLPCRTPLSSVLTATKKFTGRRQKIASAISPKATNQIVTTPGIKATRFRASGPGRRGFAVGSWKLNVSMELRFTQKTGTVSCVL